MGRLCLHCGEPLPEVARWKRLLLAMMPPPFHDPDGPDGETCWVLFNQRLGVDDPGPKPRS